MTDEIEETKRTASQRHKIYSARLIFRKIRNGKRIVGVQIRYSKKGPARNEKLEFPEDIKEGELCWKGYYGEMISIYHRKENYKYIDMNHSLIPTDIGQKLERLVLEVHFRKNPKN